MVKRMGKKHQGYNDRLDEHLGMVDKGHKKQSMAARRHESEAMEKHYGKKKYAAVKTMDKGSRKKK